MAYMSELVTYPDTILSDFPKNIQFPYLFHDPIFSMVLFRCLHCIQFDARSVHLLPSDVPEEQDNSNNGDLSLLS